MNPPNPTLHPPSNSHATFPPPLGPPPCQTVGCNASHPLPYFRMSNPASRQSPSHPMSPCRHPILSVPTSNALQFINLNVCSIGSFCAWRNVCINHCICVNTCHFHCRMSDELQPRQAGALLDAHDRDGANTASEESLNSKELQEIGSFNSAGSLDKKDYFNRKSTT